MAKLVDCFSCERERRSHEQTACRSRRRVRLQQRGCDRALHGKLRHPASHRRVYLLTFCVLVLRNGFTVTGESACASPENFCADVGRKISRAHALNKVWPLLGFQLRSVLAR
jgi:hypothetical protein